MLSENREIVFRVRVVSCEAVGAKCASVLGCVHDPYLLAAAAPALRCSAVVPFMFVHVSHFSFSSFFSHFFIFIFPNFPFLLCCSAAMRFRVPAMAWGFTLPTSLSAIWVVMRFLKIQFFS